MANPARGEVAITAGDDVWRLDFTLNALCELEDATGKTITGIAADLGDDSRVSLNLLRTVLWAGLREHHPEVDVKAAGRIASAAGIKAAMDAIGRAFALSLPKGGGENPPKAGG